MEIVDEDKGSAFHHCWSNAAAELVSHGCSSSGNVGPHVESVAGAADSEDHDMNLLAL